MTHIEDRWAIRARELADMDGEGWLDISGALVLGQEMADARAEYIALKIDDRVNRSVCIRNAYDEAITCAEIARSTIEKRKTREDILEAAIRSMRACTCSRYGEPLPETHRVDCHWNIATLALAYRPGRTPRPD